jgi:hypothetical protein
VVFGLSPVNELVKLPAPLPSEVWLPDSVGPLAVPQQTPRLVTEEPQSVTTSLKTIAEVLATLLGLTVAVTVGKHDSVLNISTLL